MTRPRRRAVLFFLLLLPCISVSSGLWLRAQRHQDALDGQLINALVKSDDQQALDLVKSGADPNTLYKPLPPPSLRQLWNYLFRRTSLPTKDNPTAFMIACGGSFDAGSYVTGAGAPENTQLIETMLQHGANLRVCDYYNHAPLLCAASYPETVRVLLAHGADVNAGLGSGSTALDVACSGSLDGTFASARLLLEQGAIVSPRRDGGIELLYSVLTSSNDPQNSGSAEILSLLLARGANPNAPNRYGRTILEYAKYLKRPDLVALLRRYGAKK